MQWVNSKIACTRYLCCIEIFFVGSIKPVSLNLLIKRCEIDLGRAVARLMCNMFLFHRRHHKSPSVRKKHQMVRATCSWSYHLGRIPQMASGIFWNDMVFAMVMTIVDLCFPQRFVRHFHLSLSVCLYYP